MREGTYTTSTPGSTPDKAEKRSNREVRREREMRQMQAQMTTVLRKRKVNHRKPPRTYQLAAPVIEYVEGQPRPEAPTTTGRARRAGTTAPSTPGHQVDATAILAALQGEA